MGFALCITSSLVLCAFSDLENAKESLALMPLSKARERLMLRALNRYGTGLDGCAQAWLSLPHSVRVFYPHAYCSRSAAKILAERKSVDYHSSHCFVFAFCQSVERGSGTQADYSGPQCQARRPGVEAGCASKTRGCWRSQLTSGDLLTFGGH